MAQGLGVRAETKILINGANLMKVKTVTVLTGSDRLPEITAKVNLEFARVYIRYTDIKVFSLNEKPEKPTKASYTRLTGIDAHIEWFSTLPEDKEIKRILEGIKERAIAACPPNPPSWDDLIDKLLVIQKANNYQPGWVVHQVKVAGMPPIQHWRRLMIELGYSFDWSGRMWVRSKQTEYPDTTTFHLVCSNTEKCKTAATVLKRKPVSACPKP
jgi:hypothetical protein